MNLKKIRQKLLFGTLLLISVANAQNPKVDSLETVLKSRSLADTTRVNALNELAYTIYKGNATKARTYAEESGKIADRIGYQKGKARSLWNVGLIHYRDDKKTSLDYSLKALAIAEKIGDKGLLSSYYTYLSSIYRRQGNIPVALDYSMLALKIEEEAGNKPRIFGCLVNMAGMHSTQKSYDLALKILQRAFLLSKEMGNSQNMSISLTNIGSIYREMKKPAALEYFKKALAANKGNDIGLRAHILNNIGSIYTEQKKFGEASQMLEEALTLNNKLGLNRAAAEVWIKQALLHQAQGEYLQTISCAQKALELAQETKHLEVQRDSHELLSTVYAATGSYANAYQSYVRYKSLSDSLLNEKNIREVTLLESKYEYAKEKQNYEIERLNREMKIKDQKQIILFLIICSILILMLAFAIYWSNRFKKRVLRLEIDNINRELEANQKAMTAATLKLIQNSERDANCLKTLENLKKNTAEDGQSEIRKLMSEYKLKSYNSNWEEFEILFEKVNASFYEKLNELFPTLTTNERRLCVFLKLNMSNNHISQITFQSEEALKKARLRLKKKLEIEREVSLTSFIQSL